MQYMRFGRISILLFCIIIFNMQSVSSVYAEHDYENVTTLSDLGYIIDNRSGTTIANISKHAAYSGEFGFYFSSKPSSSQADSIYLNLDYPFSEAFHLSFAYSSPSTNTVFRVSLIDKNDIILQLDYFREYAGAYTTSDTTNIFNIPTDYVSDTWQVFNLNLYDEIEMVLGYDNAPIASFSPTKIVFLEWYHDSAQSKYTITSCFDNLIFDSTAISNPEFDGVDCKKPPQATKVTPETTTTTTTTTTESVIRPEDPLEDITSNLDTLEIEMIVPIYIIVIIMRKSKY